MKFLKWRMLDWVIITLLLFYAVWVINPSDIPLFIHKGALAMIGAMLGFWLDYTLFKDARPENLVDLGDDGDWQLGEANVFGYAMLRRAIIMVGTMYVFGLAI